MRPFLQGRWWCALAVMLGGVAPAHAAWDNVFQVCCFGCKSKPVVSSYYAPATCCPQPCCTTQYVQRSYYQPVTCYQTQSYYEPVTTYRTSYYYEPVTSYRYSCYYDPCTCSYQQVACPTTSYRLRSQTCAVQSYLQRTCQVPVTSYRLSYYLEPVTSCYTPPPCTTPCSSPAPVVATPAVTEQAAPTYAPPVAAPSATPSYAPPTPTAPPPAAGVNENRSSPPYQQPSPGGVDRYYPPQQTMPPAGGATYRPAPAVPQAAPASTPPTVKLDRIVALPKAPSGLQGQVVHNDNSPRAGVQLVFISSEKTASQQAVTSDRAGQFRVSLASGNWLVYLPGADGKPVFHSKIEVRGEDNRQVVLVSR